MHRRWKKRLTGAISIFLTIIFVSNYALIGLLVDSGRLRMARAVAEGALDNAGASVLSYYNRMLYDLYGLFATDSLTEEDITRLLGDYAEKTLGTVPVEESALTSLVDAVTSAVGGLTGEDGEELPTFDLYSFDAEVTLVDGASHTLANTEAVEAQIIDHMKYRAPENLFNAATSGDSFLGKLQGLFDLTERMSVTKDKLELTGATSTPTWPPLRPIPPTPTSTCGSWMNGSPRSATSTRSNRRRPPPRRRRAMPLPPRHRRASPPSPRKTAAASGMSRSKPPAPSTRRPPAIPATPTPRCTARR